MNVMLLVSSMGNGGAERVASTLVNSWTERGDSVTLVATFSGRGTCFYPVSGAVRFVYLADLIDRKGRGSLTYLYRFRALRALIRSSDADVIVSFLTNVNIAAILASHGLGVPVIACEHTNPAADGRSIFWKVLCRFLYPRANVLTLLTEDMVAPFKKLVPSVQHIAVVPNPLPDELFLQQRGSFEAGARKRLISVGRLHMLKQYDLLIVTFASLADEFADWDLWIWGEGPERGKLEAKIAQLHMRERIFLPGKTTTPWIEMARAEAFVLSSRYEGLPMALMEGMALGLPAVAFDCRSGPRVLTRDGKDGLLVPPGDARAMEQALRRLLSDELLRAELGRKAALSIRERYSVRAVLHIWDELFARLGARTMK
jgi:glycosyltransferase involved in cell wall biosynthesis